MDIANERFPGRDIPVGDSSYRLPEDRWRFDVSRAENELKIKWIDLEQSITDLLTQLFEVTSND